jgi:hypothetical protein
MAAEMLSDQAVNKTESWTLYSYSLRKRIEEHEWHFSEKCPHWPTQEFLCLNEQTIDGLQVQVRPYEELCIRCHVADARAINANPDMLPALKGSDH